MTKAMQAILKDTIEVLEQRVEVKDRQLGRLMMQIEDLKKERDEARCAATGWQFAAEAYKEQI